MTTRKVLYRLVLTVACCAAAGLVCPVSAQKARDAFPPPGSSTGSCRDGRSWTTSEPQHAQMLVALNAARNAGILAAQMLATSDMTLLGRIQDFKKSLEMKVLEKAAAMER